MLIADSGRIKSDAGGLPGGPVAKPEATVTWKNDDINKRTPTNEGLDQKMLDRLEEMKTGVEKLDSFNVNSGRRPFDPKKPNDAHGKGNAVDINNINGQRVVNLKTATGPEADRAREAAANLEKWAERNEKVHQFIGPNGGWTRTRNGIEHNISKEVLDEHKNHYHIGI